MTRAHVIAVKARTIGRSMRRSGGDMCWRDHASDRVIGGDADERIACSLTIRKVFVLTLSFQAKVFL
jgi:hypothetical protein